MIWKNTINEVLEGLSREINNEAEAKLNQENTDANASIEKGFEFAGKTKEAAMGVAAGASGSFGVEIEGLIGGEKSVEERVPIKETEAITQELSLDELAENTNDKNEEKSYSKYKNPFFSDRTAPAIM